MVGLSLKDHQRLLEAVARVQNDDFGNIDIHALLIAIRPHCGNRHILRDIADFVAHGDARIKGPSFEAALAFTDSIRMLILSRSPIREYDVSDPLPLWMLRVLESQANLAEVSMLSRLGYSRESLKKAIKDDLVVDKKNKTFTFAQGKKSPKFVNAIRDLTAFVSGQTPYSLQSFYNELTSSLKECGIQYEDSLLKAKMPRLGMGILCLLAGTVLILPDGQGAALVLGSQTIHIHSGTPSAARLPGSYGRSLGNLEIAAHVPVNLNGKHIYLGISVFSTDLPAEIYCNKQLVELKIEPGVGGNCTFTSIKPVSYLTVTDNQLTEIPPRHAGVSAPMQI